MNRFSWLVMLLAAASCGKNITQPGTPGGVAVVSGLITVDGSDDFSGIELDVVARGDTLFKVVTGLDGAFSSTAWVPEAAIYTMQVSRNGVRLHLSDVILAPRDTIRITGAIPRLSNTFTIESKENLAWSQYVRAKLQYDRMVRLSLNMDIPADSLLNSVKRWSDLFDTVGETHPGTYAAEQATYLAARMLNGVDDNRMIGKLNRLGFSRTAFDQRLLYGAEARFRQDGPEAAYRHIDSLKRLVPKDPFLKMLADKRVIEVALLAGDEDRTLAELSKFVRRHSEPDYLEWAAGLRYELENLIPGRFLPPFTVPLRGDSLVSANLAGKPYMIEFVALTSPDYQREYSRLLRLHEAATKAGIVFVTVPLEPNQAVSDGFFTERPRRWTVAPAGAFQRSRLADVLRIEQVPTRFLVGADGMVLLRSFEYDLDEFQGYVDALTQTPALP